MRVSSALRDALQLAEPRQLALDLRAGPAQLVGRAAAELLDVGLGALPVGDGGALGRRVHRVRLRPCPHDALVQAVLAVLQLGRAAGGLFLGARALGDELLSDVVAVSFGFAVRPFGDLGGRAVRRRADLLGLRLGEAQHPLGPRAEAGVGRADPGPDDPDLLLDGDRVLLRPSPGGARCP